MAVYTTLNATDINQFLQDYDLGSLQSFKGIEGGIENTNYFITLENDKQQSEYVLTLFEELIFEELPYFIQLAQQLSAKQVPVPYAIADRQGECLKTLKDRPAVIQPRFYGVHVGQEQLSPAHCSAIGSTLAQFHLAAENFPLQRQAHRGVLWWRREYERIAPQLSCEDEALLREEIERFDQLREKADQLPSGTIHGDLFHDNVLFQGTTVSAVLDLYNAASAFLLYDLAIVANDWCCNADGSIDQARETALLQGYASIRAFTESETQAWPTLTCSAAMRFWLSRLIPWLDNHSDQKLKNPDDMKNILLYRRNNPSSLPTSGANPHPTQSCRTV